MKCPVDKDDLLVPATLAGGLPAFSCSQCAGVWLRSNDYLQWLRGPGAAGAEVTGEIPLPEWETADARLCPDCGRFLMRFRVLPGARKFYLDRCSHCHGVW